ncbi:MAG: serine hydrolase domain-containing protein [Pseudomonadota bacterium]|nr:serine hydrolase domain-containing protein [Pseudomonadota bacterium]
MFDTVSDPSRLGFDPGRLARFQPWMQAWVDAGKLPGAQVLIARGGEVAYHALAGRRDVEAGTPWTRDTLVRIYSMTKPITSVAFLMLFEDAKVHLDTPLDEILPEFRDVRVLIPGATALDQTEAPATRLTVHHLITHTSGLTYGFNEGPVAEAMRDRKLDFSEKGETLEATVKRLAELPLNFNPGARWNYGVSTDVLGRVVEAVSGLPLATYFQERIFAPLGMEDTFFEVPAAKLDRMAACYAKTPEQDMKLVDRGPATAWAEGKVVQASGGGGLVSTIDDYLRFTEMLRGKGAFGAERLLAPGTVELMATNALRGDLAANGQPVFSEVSYDGIGFGLGVSVTLDPGLAKTAASVGDYGWGGMASTVFWVDPKRDMTAIFLTQLVPSSTYPLRKEMRALAYSSLTAP